MALGNQDNNTRKNYEPTVYSPYRMSNTEGVDPSALSFSYTLGMLKIEIAPMKPKANENDKISFDHDKSIEVWLTHIKARLLYNEIKRYLNEDGMQTVSNVGVNTGSNGLILFSNGKELGINSPVLIIMKVDESGNPTASYAYQFRTNYHFAIKNFISNNGSASYETDYYDNLEIDQFLDVLKSYYEAQTGAVAYSMIYQGRFDASRNNTKLGLIMDKLGIENKSNGNYSRSSNSFFNNNGNSSNSGGNENNFRKSTLDSLSGAMNLPEDDE